MKSECPFTWRSMVSPWPVPVLVPPFLDPLGGTSGLAAPAQPCPTYHYHYRGTRWPLPSLNASCSALLQTLAYLRQASRPWCDQHTVITAAATASCTSTAGDAAAVRGHLCAVTLHVPSTRLTCGLSLWCKGAAGACPGQCLGPESYA